MFDWVYIQKLPIRDIKTFNANMHEGLQTYTLFGYFFMIGSILFLIVAIFKIRFIFPYIAILILFSIGYLMYNKAKSANQRRTECFVKGEAITALTTKHGRSFNPFSSTQNYTLILNYKGKNIEITHKSSKLWTEFPINSEVIGLKYNDLYLFGPEMGINFKYFLNE